MFHFLSLLISHLPSTFLCLTSTIIRMLDSSFLPSSIPIWLCRHVILNRSRCLTLFTHASDQAGTGTGTGAWVPAKERWKKGREGDGREGKVDSKQFRSSTWLDQLPHPTPLVRAMPSCTLTDRHQHRLHGCTQLSELAWLHYGERLGTSMLVVCVDQTQR